MDNPQKNQSNLSRFLKLLQHMKTQITPVYLQNGSLMGYKADIQIDGYRVTAFSFDSLLHALHRAISKLLAKISLYEGAKKVVSITNNVNQY